MGTERAANVSHVLFLGSSSAPRYVSERDVLPPPEKHPSGSLFPAAPLRPLVGFGYNSVNKM